MILLSWRLKEAYFRKEKKRNLHSGSQFIPSDLTGDFSSGLRNMSLESENSTVLPIAAWLHIAAHTHELLQTTASTFWNY